MEILTRKFMHFDKSGMKVPKSIAKFSFMDLMVLIELKKNGKSTTQDLIGYFEVDRGIMTTVISRLVSLGLIDKVKDDKDRRKTYIFLTTLGDTIYDEMAKQEQEALYFVLKDMSINEQKAILKFLSRVNQLTVEKYHLET